MYHWAVYISFVVGWCIHDWGVMVDGSFVSQRKANVSRKPSSSWLSAAATSIVVESNEEEDSTMVTSYLKRIGMTEQDMEGFYERGPNTMDLQTLYTAHLRTVPFENMDQHNHKADDDPLLCPFIPRRTSSLPSLHVPTSLHKIVHDNRGGFCFELNFSFAWLLRQMGYSVRLALADVGCVQATTPGKHPAHVILLVDNLSSSLQQNNNNNNNNSQQEDTTTTTVYLVDPGFGNPGVCDTIIPMVYNQPFMDGQGDIFELQIDSSTTTTTSRFDSILFRTRTTTTGEQESMYRFHSQDDLDYSDTQFANGLNYVLTKSQMFNGNRICVLSTANGGHVTLGKNYIKWIEKGLEVKRQELPTESSWRMALASHFGIYLQPETILSTT